MTPVALISHVVAVSVFLAGSMHRTAGAQSAASKIPVRILVPVTNSSTDTLGTRVLVRPLPDGSVIVNDGSKRRVPASEPARSQFMTPN